MLRVPHNRVAARETDTDAIAEIVRSGHWAMGPATARLETRLSEICGRRHGIVVASGLSALRLALIALGVERDHLVGVPAYSCVALANAVLSLGAKPVPLDCDPISLNVSPNALADRSDRLTCAIVVNTFGWPANFAELEQFGVPLIEDCAHGFGCAHLGTRGAVTVLSLYATKFLGSGRGGAVLADDDAVADRIRELRDYDDKPPSGLHLNEKPDDLNSALALERLAHIEADMVRRRERARGYDRALSGCAAVTVPVIDVDRIWYRYALRCPDAAIWRDRLAAKMVSAALPVTSWLDEGQLAKNPNAADAYKTVLSIPLFPDLSDAEQDTVTSALLATIQGPN